MKSFKVEVAPQLAEVLRKVAAAGDDGLLYPFDEEGRTELQVQAFSRAVAGGYVSTSADFGGHLLDRRLWLTPVGRSMVKYDGFSRQTAHNVDELRDGEVVLRPPAESVFTCTVRDELGNEAAGVSIAHAQAKLDEVRARFDADQEAMR